MASAQEVATYRATHSVAETCAHFSIKERAVYKACAKVKEQTSPLAAATARPRPRLQRFQPSGRAALYHAQLSEVADEDTVWTCPITGESYPEIPQPVPGTTKAMWLAERRRIALHQKPLALAPPEPPLCQEPAPVPVPEPVQSLELNGSTSAPQEIPAISPPAPVHLHRAAFTPVSVRHYPTRQPESIAMQGYEWASEHGPPWSIWLAFAVFLLLVLACNL